MKLVQFRDPDIANLRPGLLTEAGVIAIPEALAPGATPQAAMTGLMDRFDEVKGELQALADAGDATPLESVRLGPPLPRPGKILACIGNYWEHAERDPRPLNMFLKNPDAVIGDGDTVVLPKNTDPWIFMHEAELALVMKGPAKDVAPADWRSAVFGFTAMIDVSARGEARYTWRRGSWMGKSFDTFAPIGPAIVTADEIENPNDLDVKLWCSGEIRHDYNTGDMEHPVGELVEFATDIMTMYTGDLIACGTNHEGLGAMQDGDEVVIELEKCGRMTVHVTDPLKREWERGVYLGEGSTNLAVTKGKG